MALPQPRADAAAVVTGASSGIGEEFARQIASRGYNVILVARREDRLQALAEQIGGTIRAEVVGADLSNPAAVLAIPERVSALGLEIDILVNNAGFGYIGHFVDGPLKGQLDLIRVNCEALV